MTNMICFSNILKLAKKAKYIFSRTSHFFFLEDSFVESVKKNANQTYLYLFQIFGKNGIKDVPHKNQFGLPLRKKYVK